MRFINRANLKFPPGWPAKSNAAKVDVDGAPQKDRAGMINGYSSVWGELKDSLADISYDKCWYCETSWNRDDFAVDHYRPKNAVYGEGEGEGYYWLAFAVDNFVFSCKYCNERRRDREKGFTGGKGTYFPLSADGVRAKSEADDLLDEHPLLLSPVQAADPPLLDFQFDGEVLPAIGEGDDEDDHERGKVSIDIYHLNHHRLVQARAQVCGRLKELLERADAWFRRYARYKANGNPASAMAKASYRETIHQIAQMADGRLAYAGAVRSLLKQELSSRPWLAGLL